MVCCVQAGLDLPFSLSPALEQEILRPAFVDALTGGTPILPAVTNLTQLKARLDELLISPHGFTNAYEDLSIQEAVYERMLYGSTTERCRVDFTFGKRLSAHAYVKRAERGSESPRLAILLIPGSGFNQSSAIARMDRLNYHGAILGEIAPYGDAYVLVKPNEDFLAIHNGTNKLSYNFIYTGLIDQGGTYSGLYLIQALALCKHLQAQYDGLVIMGLSQGGAAALLVALQARPTGAMVASGYSILLQQIQWAGSNQIMIPNIDVWYARDRIRDLMLLSRTQFLFTWGRAETNYYKIEAETGLTSAYFKSVPNYQSAVHPAGHEFSFTEVAGFLNKMVRALSLRGTSSQSTGKDFRMSWSGLVTGATYELQYSPDLVQWKKVRRWSQEENARSVDLIENAGSVQGFYRLLETAP